LKTTFAALCCSLLALCSTTSAVAAPGVNASWNSGSKGKGSVAFWIRNKEGSCEEQKSALPLVFGTKNLKAGSSSGPLPVEELSYCLLFLTDAPDPNDPDGDSSNCKSGSVEFTFEAATNEYRGKYDLTMKNRDVRRGEFRAQLCMPTVKR